MLTADMIIVLTITVAAVFLFTVEWVRVDVVAIIVMVSLPLLGLLNHEEAFIGFSSNAVISIIAVIMISAGLDRTGAMSRIAKTVTKLAGNSENKLIFLVSGTVAVISTFMQNIGAVALFMPATRRVCKKMDVAPARVLMPMGFLGIIGGCLSLIGSSPLILLNDLIAAKDLEPFGLFDVTPIGLALVVAALGYFLLFGRFVLPSAADRSSEDQAVDLGTIYRCASDVHELLITESFPSGKTIEEMAVRTNYLITVVGSATRNGCKDFTPLGKTALNPGDSIAVVGAAENIKKLSRDHGLTLKSKLDVFEDELSPDRAGLLEAIVKPRSGLEGKTLGAACFREIHQVNPMALRKKNRIYYGGLSDITLHAGDVLLLEGLWLNFAKMKESKDVALTTNFEAEIVETHKIKWALLCFAVAIALVLTGTKLSIALMTGALGMIVTGVLSIDDAYDAVDWRTVFLLAGLIPLGIAIEKTGTTAYLANAMLGLMSGAPPIVLLTVIAIITSIFTLVVSNVGATVLLVPLAVNLAISGGADARMAALTVAVAASNTFILPTHQVNAYIMSPGGYSSRDFIKAGSAMTLLYIVVLIGSMYLFYGISS